MHGTTKVASIEQPRDRSNHKSELSTTSTSLWACDFQEVTILTMCVLKAVHVGLDNNISYMTFQPFDIL